MKSTFPPFIYGFLTIFCTIAEVPLVILFGCGFFNDLLLWFELVGFKVSKEPFDLGNSFSGDSINGDISVLLMKFLLLELELESLESDEGKSRIEN
ncbi:hypothetical protein WICMUC_005177 [Wickerhamomyces mucosus]|uniref:Uncharacterized protein n=1 Tax=Wickerhamomyces mucosus TaxID=1378264 RepID=A0A9P8PAH4_9ASCO|nr:hypothetical protein WICMUC_005177 [Wickerhamomyces mucosus]